MAVVIRKWRVMKDSTARLMVDWAGGWGLRIDRHRVDSFALYLDRLIIESRRHGITSLRDEEAIAINHFLDSLSCLVPGVIGKDSRVIDVGAGGGFPSLPIKILLPAMDLTLLEASGRKTAFLRRLAQDLKLDGVTVTQARAEDLGRQVDRREAYKVALARAVAPPAAVLEYTLPLLQMGGAFIAQRGKYSADELGTVTAVAPMLGGSLESKTRITLPGNVERNLWVIRKVSSTPGKYPRRPGIPEKRPLAESAEAHDSRANTGGDNPAPSRAS